MKAVLVWILALLIGAVVPALLTVVVFEDLRVLLPAFFITLSHAAALGLPTALLCRGLGLTRARWALIGGFAIGGLPSAIFLWADRTSWLDYALFVGGLGCLGALGAFTCWLTFRLSGLLPR